MTAINKIRYECETLRVRKNLHKRGSCKELAKTIGCNANSLVMALSGFRNNPRSVQILSQLRDHLLSLEPQNGALL